MLTSEIKELIKGFAEIAKKNLIKDKELTPVAFTFHRGQMKANFLFADFSQEGRLMAWRMTGAKAKHSLCDSVLYINEVAMKAIKLEDGKLPKKRPLDYPVHERQDGIMLYFVNFVTEKAVGRFIPFVIKDGAYVFGEMQDLEGDLGGDMLQETILGYKVGSKLMDMLSKGQVPKNADDFWKNFKANSKRG